LLLRLLLAFFMATGPCGRGPHTPPHHPEPPIHISEKQAVISRYFESRRRQFGNKFTAKRLWQ